MEWIGVLVVDFDEDVVWFEVAVADSSLVHETHAFSDLEHDGGDVLAVEVSVFEGGVVAVLHDEVVDFASFVDEEVVGLDDSLSGVEEAIVVEGLDDGVDDLGVSGSEDLDGVLLRFVLLLPVLLDDGVCALALWNRDECV